MKKLIKFALVAVGLGVGALSALPAAAAETNTDVPKERHPRLRALVKQRAAMRAEVARRLDLTDEQKAQLKSGRAKTAETLKTLRHDPNLTREQKREQARDALEAARAELRGVLTPEQQAKLDQARESRRTRRPNRG
jgi:Spy/CpxP family protein refolding chaperone